MDLKREGKRGKEGGRVGSDEGKVFGFERERERERIVTGKGFAVEGRRKRRWKEAEYWKRQVAVSANRPRRR